MHYDLFVLFCLFCFCMKNIWNCLKYNICQHQEEIKIFNFLLDRIPSIPKCPTIESIQA